MNKVKEKLLNDTYTIFIQTSLADYPMEDIPDFIDEKFSGYGTALNEKLLSISDYRELVERQRVQAKVITFEFTSTPVTRKVFADGNSALYVDEIVIKLHVNNESTEMLLRLSTVLEYRDEKWIVIHFHGSKPEYAGGDNDPWHVGEWQQKNAKLEKLVEENTADLLLKNRELEIEAALEKVRTDAMGMRKPDDMLDVCKTISLQLHALGVKEIRNVQTAIFYQHRGTYMNYEYYAKHKKTFITETTYANNEIHQEFATKMMKGKGEFFITHIKDKEVKEWIAYQKTTNVFIDKYLEKASSLNYYWFSLGPVALGISTYQPLTEAETNLFNRFLKVFELAYQRYLDIEKAQAQAREAQIELSLERIRAQATAMKESGDLLDIVVTMRSEFGALGHEAHYFWHMRWLPDKYEKAMTSGDGTRIGMVMDLPRGFHGNAAMIKWEKNNDPVGVFAYDVKGAIDYVDRMIKTGRFHEIDPNAPGPDDIRAIGGLTFVMARTTHGEIGYSLPGVVIHPPPEDLATLIRFAGVFDLAYRRFEDLKEAEAQAREAQIELALERVRARTMAMQYSDELKDTALSLFQQVKELGIPAWGCGFNIWDEDKKAVTSWNSSEGQIEAPIKIPSNGDIFLRIYHAAQKGESTYVEEMGGKALEAHYRYMATLPGVSDILNQFSEAGIVLPTFQIFHIAYFSHGYLMFITYEAVPEARDIFKRYAKVFEQTYTRFLDLQKAEAQAREAQIENALEKVRSRTMAMQRSEELPEAANNLFLQVQALGIPAWSAGYCIWNDEDKSTATACMSSEGVIQKPFVLPTIGEGYNFYEHLHNGRTFYVEELGGEALVKHYKFMRTLPIVGEVLDGIIEAGFPLPTFQIFHIVYFPQGYLMFITYEPVPDAHDIFKRFSKVFKQTYTRFLDLQKAESQAREAQIEASLERVRSKTMAMHNSDDVGDTVVTLFDEVLKLDLDKSIRCGIGILEGTERMETWSATSYPNGDVDLKMGMLDMTIHPLLVKIKDSWKSGNTRYTDQMTGKSVIRYYTGLNNQPDYHFYRLLDTLPETEYHNSFSFPEGIIFAFSPNPMSEETAMVLAKFASVFGQTYRRYIDLQKAEEQAREAQIEAALERVRSRTMGMQKSEELKDVIQIVYEQFVHLNIHIEHTGFIIDYKARDDMHIWLADQNGAPSQVTIPYFDSPHWNSYNEAKEKGIDFFANHLNFEEKNRFYKKLFKYIPGLPEEAKEFYLSCSGLAISTVLLENVGLYIENFSGIPYSDEENDTLMRFGKVFQQTYTRFNDLQKAEAQAREAQIEAALERVRSKTLAMHQSDKLAETAAIVFKQLIGLGIAPNRLYIGIIKDSSLTIEFWVTEEDGTKISKQFTGDIKKNASIEKMYQAWKKKKNSIIIDMHGKELKEYFRYLSDELHVPFKQGLSQKRRIQNIAYFSEGFLGIASPDSQPEETTELLKRFASVFNLTYTRFNDLQQAEAQNKIIQAENERKTEELEEARELQLAMLPKQLPKFADLEIAVHMKTATEVGGDYYDFCLNDDDSLNICLGDATGHGMKAGIMVSAMKSIFTTNAPKMDIEQFFSYANSGIKSMNLKRMMMGFIMLNINKNLFRIINAGMPPIFLYRKNLDAVDEIIVHGMPIGAMNHSHYSVTELLLDKDDVILLLSDGMPELQNHKNEMYGYNRIKNSFKKVAEKSPEEIIGYLKDEGSAWVNDKDPDDDVTFVVIKVK